MTKKKAQKPDSHDNDYRAISDLKRVFGNWNITELSDFFSKIEYGQDSMVTIIDGSEITGAEFRVQSKVFTTPNQVKGKSLATQIKVSTLNSLAELAMPVMLHYVDFVNGISYWMWFDEWYEKNYDNSWENDDKKSVSIRKKKNRFKQRSKKKIRQRVIREHVASLLQKKAQIHSKIDSDYNYDYYNIRGANIVVVNPKHDNPRTLTFSTNEENARLINQAIERGVSVTFKQESFIKGLPTLAEFEAFEITLIPLIPEQNSFLKIQFFDENNVLLHEIEFIEMKLVQHGSMYKQFRGIHNISNTIMMLSFDAEKHSTDFIIEPDFSDSPSATQLYGYWYLMTLIKNTRYLTVKNLKTDEFAKIDSSVGLNVTPLDKVTLIFLKNLSSIESQFGIKFRPEGDFSSEEVSYAEAIVDIVTSGFTQKITLIPENLINDNTDEDLKIVGYDRKDKIMSIMKRLQVEETLNINAGTVENVKVSLLDHEINLGSAQQIVTAYNILFYDETQKAIKAASDSDLVEIHLQFKIDESYLIFNEWKQEIADA